MSAYLKAKLTSLCNVRTLRVIYVLVVVAALALAAGAPYAWGGTGP